MWENVVERGGPYVTIWRVRIAWRILKATPPPLPPHTHTIYNTYRFSTTTMVARTRLDVTSYVHCRSCYFSVSFRVKMARYWGTILGASVFYFAYNRIAFFVCLSVHRKQLEMCKHICIKLADLSICRSVRRHILRSAKLTAVTADAE